MKTLKILFVSALFTLSLNSCTDLNDSDNDLDAIHTEDIQSFTGENSQDDGSKD